MKLLFIHSNEMRYELTSKTQYAEPVDEGQKQASLGECLVVYVCVEERDEVNIDLAVKEGVKEIEEIYSRLSPKRIVITPYAHLSSSLASPPIALEILQKIKKELEDYEVIRIPFGWYKRFKTDNKGHPLSTLSRTINVEAQERPRTQVVKGGVCKTSIRRFDPDRGLHIYNSLTKRKELFMPHENNEVGMYVCGVTVYDSCHVGHARAYVTFDVIRRYLEYRGYSVFYVQNFTDIDDKIIERAKEENKDIKEIAERFTDEYFEYMDKLRIKKASVYPKATQHIKEMIAIIQGLLDKGYAYNTDGNVFFEVNKFKDYGKLSGRVADDSPGVTRVEADSGKRAPADFALWKRSKEGEPAWESPWGLGRPGWHIECSAMSMKYLGKTLDIHGGGQDLIFPHHENEIAQSESYTGQPFVKYWLHNGFVTIEGEKMSKSLGNICTLKDIFKDYSPENLRFLFLTAHYRSPISFGIEKLKEAKTGLDKIHNLLETIEFITTRSSVDELEERELTEGEESLIEGIQRTKKKFEASMDDDFNTPVALGALFDLVKDTNIFIKNAINGKEQKVDNTTTQVLNKVLTILGELMELLGLPSVPTGKTDKASELLTSIMQILTEVRNIARAEKNWKISDKIRSELDKLGAVLEDHREGTTWKWK